MSSPTIDAWRARGRFIATPDGEVFVVRLGGGDGIPVLVLHGFPTSSWDFAACVASLASERPVVLFDFLGFGLSDKPVRYAYSLLEQADVALAVARAEGITRAHVWAHDMGTSVATELVARRERIGLPFELVSLTLMNGSVHIELAHLTPGQKVLRTKAGPLFARLMNATAFRVQMRRLFPRPPSDAELDAMWALLARADGALRLPAISGYLTERTRFEGRWIGALTRLDAPTLVAWGRRDPVAVDAIARRLAEEIPGAHLRWWDELGHYPQVEDPARVADTVGAFWREVDAGPRR